jgi:hypothetical protein
MDKPGKYTDVKMDKAFSRLTKDYVGKSKAPLSPSAPVDKAQGISSGLTPTSAPASRPMPLRRLSVIAFVVERSV